LDERMHTESNAYVHGYANCNFTSVTHAYSYCYCDTYAYSDGYTYVYAYTYTHAYCHAQGDADAKNWANTEVAPQSPAPPRPIALSLQL
jgi:hypothetical protein